MRRFKKYKGFNAVFYRKRRNPYADDRIHEQGKHRLAGIAAMIGYRIVEEKEFPKSMKIMNLKRGPYMADVYCYKLSNGPNYPPVIKEELILEADGLSHTRINRKWKDGMRDEYFAKYEKIRTVRFPLEYLVGPDCYNDQKIIYRIKYGVWPERHMTDEEILRQITSSN